MILLALAGVIFIAIAVAVGVDVWQVNSGHVAVTAFNHTFSQPAWAVLVAGAVCGALVVLGLETILAAGGGRRNRPRPNRRAARRGGERPEVVPGRVEADTVTRRSSRGAHFAGRRPTP
jgi:hypothetical protein